MNGKRFQAAHSKYIVFRPFSPSGTHPFTKKAPRACVSARETWKKNKRKKKEYIRIKEKRQETGKALKEKRPRKKGGDSVVGLFGVTRPTPAVEGKCSTV